MCNTKSIADVVVELRNTVFKPGPVLCNILHYSSPNMFKDKLKEPWYTKIAHNDSTPTSS